MYAYVEKMYVLKRKTYLAKTKQGGTHILILKQG